LLQGAHQVVVIKVAVAVLVACLKWQAKTFAVELHIL
jgi:hypothetical protein